MLKTSKYAIGIGLLILGLILVIANYCMIAYENMYFPKMLMAGIIITFMGIGFLFFPGPAIDPQESSDYWKRLWRESPGLHKVMWILFTLIGVALSIYTFVYFDLRLAD